VEESLAALNAKSKDALYDRTAKVVRNFCLFSFLKNDKVIRKFLTTARGMGHHEIETRNWHKL
jgi:hypothetical protein